MIYFTPDPKRWHEIILRISPRTKENGEEEKAVISNSRLRFEFTGETILKNSCLEHVRVKFRIVLMVGGPKVPQMGVG